MSINGDCLYCGGHSTDEEWDSWNGECQWCGQFDVEWEKSDEKDDGDYDSDGLNEDFELDDENSEDISI